VRKFCSCCGSRPAQSNVEGSNCKQCDEWIFEKEYRPLFKKVSEAFQKEENRKTFDEMDDETKTVIINMMIEDGIIAFGPVRSVDNKKTMKLKLGV